MTGKGLVRQQLSREPRETALVSASIRACAARLRRPCLRWISTTGIVYPEFGEGKRAQRPQVQFLLDAAHGEEAEPGSGLDQPLLGGQAIGDDQFGDLQSVTARLTDARKFVTCPYIPSPFAVRWYPP